MGNSLMPQVNECSHCYSVTGAMSYYVALLEMLRYSEKNDDGLTPYDILISQRPDLPHIKLNCANLDTIIPLIDASTGVMEYYVANNKLDKDAVHNTGEFTREELRAEPQYFMPAAYKELSNAVFPLSMPYHQPLDLIRTYLGQMQISRSELMKTFSKSFDGSVDTKNNLFFAEDLGLSETEFRILTQKKLDDSDTDGDAGSLSKLYGYPDDATMSAKIFKAEELLWQTGIKYTDLIAIVKARIINPDQHLIKYLEAVYKETGMKEKEFYDELTRINTTDNPAPAAAIVAALKVLDEDEKKFIGFVKSEFENFKKIVTLFSDDDIHNDLSKTHLKILKNVFENKPEAGVDNGVYSKMNRFIRLWKKTGYTIEELDMLISAFQEKDITPSLLAKLAIFKKIKAATTLPVKQLVTLWTSIDTSAERSLYKDLFLTSKTKPNDNFKMQLGSYLVADKSLKDHLSFLQLAFKISADELNGIIQIEFPDPDAAKLTLANVSSIYRYSVLSRGLGITISELLQLVPLFKEMNPFAILTKQVFEQPDVNRSLRFNETVQKIKRSAFKISNLNYIMGDKEDVFNSLFDDVRLTGFLEEIQSGIKALATQHPSPDQSEIVFDTAFLQAQLPTLFTDDISAVLVAMINGSIEYSTKIPPGATAVIPDGMKRKYVFENNLLTCRGIMTDKEQGELMNAEAGNAAWKAGVDKIYTAPEKFITEKLSSIFTDTAAAIKTLLFHKPGAGDVEKTAAQKIKFTYEQMYPVLIKKIPDQLVNAAVSSLLGLPADAGEMFIDENTCQLIRDSKKDDPGPLKKLLVPLHKIALFVSGFKLSYKEIKYIKDSKDKPDVFDSLDFTNLKAIHWQRICNYVLLRDSLKINNDLLIDFFLTGKNDLLSIACNWPKKDLELIIAEFGFAGNALKNEKALIVITKCMEMINRTGLAAEVLISWAKADAVLNFDTCFDLSLTIKELVKAKYEDDEWLEVAKKLTDSLRENQRQALVTFLCNKLDMDEGELTEKFLIDVSVCACMDASQIKLAIGSIHLFVNQCLLNQRSKIEGGKEKGVAAKAINKRNWDGYMHSVVLWEAYRKVIIHASDYLDPKWLFEMSPIFKKCRSEMTQGDITNESATNVFKLYARELHEVANLKILSVFQEITTTGFLLYVIGRTKAAPYKYHFRTCDHLLNCSAWESIPIQIKNNDDGVNSGEHVMILRHQDRSLLFMLEFNEQVQSDNEEGFSKNATELSTVPLNKTSGTKYWEIRLAWSELKGDKWSEKRISNETINRPQNESTTTKMTATFRMQTDLIVRNFVKSVNGNDSADAVERRPLRLNNYFTKVALNTNSIEFNLINENGDGVGKFGFDMFTSTASVITRSIQIQEGAYLKQNQFYQSVNNYGKLTVHQNDYLLATKNHYRTFSPLINDIEALDYHFIYHDKDRSYLVLSENFTHYKSVPLEEEPTTMLAKFRNTTAAESVIVRSRHNDTQEVFNGINHIIVNNP